MKDLDVIKIYDLDCCRACPFAHLVRVSSRRGSVIMFYCARGDCDNWIYEGEMDYEYDYVSPFEYLFQREIPD